MSERSPASFEPGLTPPDDSDGPTWIFAFRGRELLVTRDGGGLPHLEFLEKSDVESLRSQFLGRCGDARCHSVELAPDSPAPPGLMFRDLRALYGSMDDTLHAIAGRAVQIVEWERTHLYCGACGAETERADNERSRVCPKCRLTQFPRLSPAMIVAVERDEEILLGRSAHFPAGIYSVLAGFVEPGESVEEAVIREVREEADIECDEVEYFGSQPWPYPNSLMLGFRARYKRGEVRCGDGELEDAQWFRHDAMPTFFPGNMSISQWLIQDFLKRHQR